MNTYWKALLRAGVLVGGLWITSPALAFVQIQWVPVGDPENPADSNGHGAVDHEYGIGEYEVINYEYVEFLNAVAKADPNGLYDVNMGDEPRGGITRTGSPGDYTYSTKSNMGLKPANYISFFDAMRFVNWLHNGQPTGAQDASTTESGVYTISDGLSETRAGNARYFIPTVDEWYKAAYYQPATDGGDSDNYWLYPTQSNTAPTVATADSTGDIDNSGDNVANYNFGADWNGQDGNVTTRGSAHAKNYYNTFDQGGNVWEWVEGQSGSSRLHFGGDWGPESLPSTATGFTAPGYASATSGLRVGVNPTAQCEVVPSSLDFGFVEVDHAKAASFTIRNIGVVSFSGSIGESCDNYSISSGGSYTLDPGEARTVSVTFTPTATGAYSCTIATGASCGDVDCAGHGFNVEVPVSNSWLLIALSVLLLATTVFVLRRRSLE